MTTTFNSGCPVPPLKATPPITLETVQLQRRQASNRLDLLTNRQWLLTLAVLTIIAILVDQRCDALAARIAVLEHQLEQVQADLLKERQFSAALDRSMDDRIGLALGERIIAAVSTKDGGWLIEQLERTP